MHRATVVEDVVDLSDGRVPAAVELAQRLAAADQACRERRRAAQQARVDARAVLERFAAAQRVGWSPAELEAAGLVPSDAIRHLALEPDDPEV